MLPSGELTKFISGLVLVVGSHGRQPAVRKEVEVVKEKEDVREGYEVVYTAFITLKNGKRIYASSYGLKAFRLEIRK